jgi:hypothetical protein
MSDEFKVPTALNEANADALRKRDPRTGEAEPDHALAHLANALKTSREIAERSKELADALKRDRTMTPAARAVKLKSTVLSVAERGTSAIDSALATLDSEIARLEHVTSSPPPGDPALAAEIRSRLASMKPDARREALTTAISEGDDTITAAALSAPAMLSGFAKTELDALRLKYRQARHASDLDRLGRLKTAKTRAELAGRSFVDFTRGAATDPEAMMGEVAQNNTQEALRSLETAGRE